MRTPFKYYIRSTVFIGAILFATAYAAGVVQKFATDTVQFGGTSVDNKELIFDTGDGGSNAKISVDNATPSFSLNKSMDVTGSGSFTTTGQFGGSINSDGNSFTLGDGTANNKSITFDIGGVNPLIRWNQSEVALEFSNDGTNFKKIGSGSGAGGGINLLAELNADFESGTPPSNWTSSGGTFVEDITTPIFDKKSGVWDSSALSQTLTSATKVIERGMIGRVCSANLYYRYVGGATDDIQFQVRLNGSSTIAERGIPVTTGTNVAQVQLVFDCPTTATDTLSLRLLANVSNPTAITIDNAFVGSDKNSFQLSQAQLLAEVTWASTASCNPTVDTAGSFVFLPVTAACPAPTLTAGTVSITDAITDTMSVQLNNVPPGKIVGTFTMQFEHPTSGVPLAVRLVETVTGTNGVPCQTVTKISGGQETISCNIVVNNPTGQNLIFRSQIAETGAGSVLWLNDTGGVGGGRQTRMIFTRYPLQAAEAITLETTGWFFDGNIGGAVVDLGTGAVSSYATATNAGLDLVINPGSVVGRIVCNANPSTGLTCAAGNEEMGVSVDIPQSGLYEACFGFTHNGNVGASGDLNTAFQVVRTADASGAILEEGKTRTVHSVAGSATNTVSIDPTYNCGTFSVSSAGRHAFRLYYEQAVSGTINASQVQLDRNASNGQRDMHITIRPLNQQFPTPVFTALNTSLNERPISSGTTERIERFFGACTASSSITNQSGSWVTSIGNISAGNCVITIAGGKFSATPTCTVQTQTGSTVVGRIVAQSSTSLTVGFFVSTSGANSTGEQFNLICMGAK
jgi:hypothetical protein